MNLRDILELKLSLPNLLDNTKIINIMYLLNNITENVP